MAGQPIAKPIKIEVNIKPGPASPAQKAAWRKFWQKLLTEVKENLKGGKSNAQ